MMSFDSVLVHALSLIGAVVHTRWLVTAAWMGRDTDRAHSDSSSIVILQKNCQRSHSQGSREKEQHKSMGKWKSTWQL